MKKMKTNNKPTTEQLADINTAKRIILAQARARRHTVEQAKKGKGAYTRPQGKQSWDQ